MYLYLTLILFTSLYSFTNFSKHKKNQIYFVYSSAIIFILLFGFRKNIGGDWINYEIYYNTINSHFNPFKFNLLENDYLFDLINWISFNFDLSYYFVNFLNFCIFIIFFSIFITKFKYPVTALLLAIPYVIIVAGTGYVRQASAFGFLLIAILYLIDKKILLFLTFIILGTLFHKTVFLMVILLPIVLFDFKKNINFIFDIKSIIAIIVLIIISVFFYYIFLQHKFSFILYYYVGEGRFFSSSGGIFRFLPYLFSSILFLLYYKNINLKITEYKIYFFYSIFIIICTPLVYKYSSAIDRILLYFYPIQLLILSQLHVIFKDIKNRIFYNGIITMFVIIQFLIWVYFGKYSKHWLYYNNIFLDYIL